MIIVKIGKERLPIIILPINCPLCLLIIRASYFRFADLHTIKGNCFLLDLFIRHAENIKFFVHKRGVQSTAESINPMMRSSDRTKCRCEQSRRVHAAASIKPERGNEHGHSEVKFYRYWIRVLLISDWAAESRNLWSGSWIIRCANRSQMGIINRAECQMIFQHYDLQTRWSKCYKNIPDVVDGANMVSMTTCSL